MGIKVKQVGRPVPENFDALISDASIDVSLMEQIPNIIQAGIGAKAKYDEGWVKGFAEESMEQLDTEVTTDLVNRYYSPEDDVENNPFISEQDYTDAKKFASNKEQGNWTQRQYDMARNNLVKKAIAARPGVDPALIINEFNKHTNISSVPYYLDMAAEKVAAEKALSDDLLSRGNLLGVERLLWETDREEYMRQLHDAEIENTTLLNMQRTLAIADAQDKITLLDDTFKRDFQANVMPLLIRRARPEIDKILESNNIPGGLDGLANLAIEDATRIPGIKRVIEEWRLADRANLLNLITIEGRVYESDDEYADTPLKNELAYEKYSDWVNEQLVEYDKFTKTLVDAVSLESLQALQDTMIKIKENGVLLNTEQGTTLSAINKHFGAILEGPLGEQFQRQISNQLVGFVSQLFGATIDGTDNPITDGNRRVVARGGNGTLIGTGPYGSEQAQTETNSATLIGPKASSDAGDFDMDQYMNTHGITNPKDRTSISISLLSNMDTLLNSVAGDGRVTQEDIQGIINYTNAWATTHENVIKQAQMQPSEGAKFRTLSSREETRAFVRLFKNPNWGNIQKQIGPVIYNHLGIDVGNALTTEYVYITENDIPELNIILNKPMGGVAIPYPDLTEEGRQKWYNVPEVVDTTKQQSLMFGGRAGAFDLVTILSYMGPYDPREEIRIKDLIKLDFDDKGTISFVAQSPEELGYEVTAGGGRVMGGKLTQTTPTDFTPEKGKAALDRFVEQLNLEYSGVLTDFAIAKSNVESTAIPGKDWYTPKDAAQELVNYARN